MIAWEEKTVGFNLREPWMPVEKLTYSNNCLVQLKIQNWIISHYRRRHRKSPNIHTFWDAGSKKKLGILPKKIDYQNRLSCQWIFCRSANHCTSGIEEEEGSVFLILCLLKPCVLHFISIQTVRNFSSTLIIFSAVGRWKSVISTLLPAQLTITHVYTFSTPMCPITHCEELSHHPSKPSLWVRPPHRGMHSALS